MLEERLSGSSPEGDVTQDLATKTRKVTVYFAQKPPPEIIAWITQMKQTADIGNRLMLDLSLPFRLL